MKQLQDEADEVIERLGRAVKYDMATAEEKAQLEVWERYSVLLSRVKLEDAPYIELLVRLGS
ncbi:tail fiber assembly protein [Serratia marcescens]|uniref:tail fiber assembly protein n=1 Tax=Serratia marcescens TaxID=615 RepID=UPI003C12C8BF